MVLKYPDSCELGLSVFNVGLQPRDKAAMLEVKTIRVFSRRIYMEMISSLGREMLLSLTTNMAAVTSRAN